MADIVIYTTMFCPFCHRAKHLLKDKGVAFEEIDVTMSSGKRAEMMELASGRHTVPQIFIDGEGIGGCDELYAMEYDGTLDAKLGIAA
ncbi:MAG: glutaredoxin 3 [Rhodospirillaceae bacterium]|nr:glutaredoxin 3 [Rhodospirillaceae bacterium]|tara:strand:- start:9419 stop:9682 length:264 start_codon:yes stop_codon:yes gene_type:complete